MAIPEIELSLVDTLLKKYCEKRLSCSGDNNLKLFHIVKGNKAILIESRRDREDPGQWTERPVAHFGYQKTTKGWSVFGYNRDSKSLTYLKGHLEKMIQAVDEDSAGVFWGNPKHKACLTE